MKLPSEQDHLAALVADEKRISGEADPRIAAMKDREKAILKKLDEVQVQARKAREGRDRLIRQQS